MVKQVLVTLMLTLIFIHAYFPTAMTEEMVKVGSINLNSDCSLALWSSDGELLAIVAYWESPLTKQFYSKIGVVLKNGTILWTTDKLKGFAKVLWNPNNRVLAIVLEDSLEDFDIIVYDALSGKVLGKYEGKGVEVDIACWNPDGSQLTFPIYNLSGKFVKITAYSNDLSMKLWETEKVEKAVVSWIEWSPTGKRIVVSALKILEETSTYNLTLKHIIYVLNSNGELLWERELFKTKANTLQMVLPKWSLDGKYLAIASFHTSNTVELRVFDVEGNVIWNKTLVKNMENITHASLTMEWVSNGKLALAISYVKKEAFLKGDIFVFNIQGELLWHRTFNYVVNNVHWDYTGNFLVATLQLNKNFLLKIFSMNGDTVLETSIQGPYVDISKQNILAISGTDNVVIYKLFENKSRSIKTFKTSFTTDSKETFWQRSILPIILTIIVGSLFYLKRKRQRSS